MTSYITYVCKDSSFYLFFNERFKGHNIINFYAFFKSFLLHTTTKVISKLRKFAFGTLQKLSNLN